MAIDLFSIGRFTIHGYGLMIGLGFLVAVLLGGYLSKKKGLSDGDFTNMAMLVLIIGFAGGKLLHIIVEFRTFLADPVSVLGSEGFVVYGGIITGIATIYVYCKVKKLQMLDYFDVFASVVPINQALGRIGCLLAGCCYGKETTSRFSLVFPEGSMAPAGIHLIPTQPLMAAGNFVIFVTVTLIFIKKKGHAGLCTAMYLMLYSVGRFIIEFFRNDYRGEVGILSTSQFIAIFTFAAALILLIKVMKGSSGAEDKAEDA